MIIHSIFKIFKMRYMITDNNRMDKNRHPPKKWQHSPKNVYRQMIVSISKCEVWKLATHSYKYQNEPDKNWRNSSKRAQIISACVFLLYFNIRFSPYILYDFCVPGCISPNDFNRFTKNMDVHKMETILSMQNYYKS